MKMEGHLINRREKTLPYMRSSLTTEGYREKREKKKCRPHVEDRQARTTGLVSNAGACDA